jgi:hypothetical protein
MFGLTLTLICSAAESYKKGVIGLTYNPLISLVGGTGIEPVTSTV